MVAELLTDIKTYVDSIDYGFEISDKLESQLLENALSCCLRSGCNASIIDMANNQTLSKRIEDGILYIAISDGNEIAIPLADIGDDWGSQVINAGTGFSGDGSTDSPFEFSTDVKNRLETVFVSINEITASQRPNVTVLPYDGEVKYVVPDEQEDYIINAVRIHDSNSTGVVLKNGSPVTLGTTTVAAGDVLSIRITAIGNECTATIKLTKALT